ncbi:MAG: acetyl-CoA/propionyl-CoA carboxylase carboxyl transferase subunit [Pseudonocardiales bacterium]|nr:acetyl-CoA/propionyl-CoA carboxylase carboxyl transferase subunit [Pseudonocardiales bacterium]
MDPDADREMDMVALCDRGTLRLLSDVDSAGVVIARGCVLGRPVIAYAASSGSLGAAGSKRIVWAVDSAAREGVPVLGLWYSDGPAWDGAGDVFAAMVRASGRVPQICVVLGSSGADGGCGPALSDVVIAGPGGSAADVVCSSDALAVQKARLVVSLLGDHGHYSAVPEQPMPDGGRNLAMALFDSSATHLSAVADSGPVELRAQSSPQVVTALGRMGGHTIGVVAATGLLDGAGAAKAARFVRMCDASRVPLVVVADVVEVAGRTAKLLHALASTSVPRVTVVPRTICGPYFVMNSRSLGASAVFAWPGADVAGAVDEVISPDATRRRVVEVLAMARERRSSGMTPLQPPILHK